MNASTRWTVRNVLLLLLVVVPAVVLLTAISTAIAGYDRTTLAPARLLGDLAMMYPVLAVPLALGGLVQSIFTLFAVRTVPGRARLVGVVLAPLAFLPLLFFKFVDVRSFYLAVPILLAVALYAALINAPPTPAAAAS